MATKEQVIRKAKKLGCEVEFDSASITVVAPQGFLIDGEMHYSSFEYNSGYTRHEIYENLIDELSVPLVNCNGSGCCDSEDL